MPQGLYQTLCAHPADQRDKANRGIATCELRAYSDSPVEYKAEDKESLRGQADRIGVYRQCAQREEPMFKFMHAYTYLETCVQQYMTLGAVESASPDKSGGPTSRVAPLPYSPPEMTETPTKPTGFLRMKSSPAPRQSVPPAVDDEIFAAAVPDSFREKFILLVVLRFKQCTPSRVICRIHA
jgi:hypothetical protein